MEILDRVRALFLRTTSAIDDVKSEVVYGVQEAFVSQSSAKTKDTVTPQEDIVSATDMRDAGDVRHNPHKD